jgi:hypothetical protein
VDLDSLLHHYLDGGLDSEGGDDPARLAAAGDRIALDFGIERDAGRRFALWALLLMLGRAPDIDAAFKREADRRAARDFARLMARAEAHAEDGG